MVLGQNEMCLLRVFFFILISFSKLSVKHICLLTKTLRICLGSLDFTSFTFHLHGFPFETFIFNCINNRRGGRNSVGLSSGWSDIRRHCDVRHTKKIPKRLPEQGRISEPGV